MSKISLDGKYVIRKKPVLKCKRLSKNATIPSKKSKKSIGLEIYSAYDYVIQPNERMLCLTDMNLELPIGFYARIVPRSNIAQQNYVDVVAGNIDASHQYDNVGVVLVNYSPDPFEVKVGQPIGELILQRAYDVPVEEVDASTYIEQGGTCFSSTTTEPEDKDKSN